MALQGKRLRRVAVGAHLQDGRRRRAEEYATRKRQREEIDARARRRAAHLVWTVASPTAQIARGSRGHFACVPVLLGTQPEEA